MICQLSLKSYSFHTAKRVGTRIIATIFLTVLVTTVFFLPKASAALAITLNPTNGPPGTIVAVSGSGFTPNGQVQIFFINFGIVATLVSNSTGAIIGLFIIPNINANTYNVAAKDVTTQNDVQTPFTVQQSSGPTPTPSTPDLNYTVTIQDNQPTVHVKLEIANITTTALSLKFSDEAWYAENYTHNLSAVSGGTSLNVMHAGQGKWIIPSVGSLATFDYDIDKNIPFGFYSPTNGTISVFFNNDGGVIMAPFFFIYPDVTDLNSVTIKFNVPAGWQVVTPYPMEGDHFRVQRITNSLLNDFIKRQQIYMGNMKFYAEKQLANCTLKLGVLQDDASGDAGQLNTQAKVENYLNVTAICLENLTGLYGENPYKVYTMYTVFQPLQSGLVFPAQRYGGNGNQIWPEHRWDELLAHMSFAFVIKYMLASAPCLTTPEVADGMMESYYDVELAWRMFKDPTYLGKLYYWYLIYERYYPSNITNNDDALSYLKGAMWGLMLDNETQRLTGGAKSLDDVIRYIYSKYKNTGQVVDHNEVQQAEEAVTGQSFGNLFAQYINGNQQIPYKYIESYKPYFLQYPQLFANAFPYENFPSFNSTVPFFINIEMMVHQDVAISMNSVIYAGQNVVSFANYILSHYAIANLTEKNVEDSLSAITNANCSGFFTRWQDSFGRLSLDQVKAWLQSYSSASTSSATITITSNQPGSGSVTVDGVAITTPDAFTWTAGSTHTLQASSPLSGPVGTRYVWTGWSDGGSQTHTYTVPNSNVTVTANYKIQYLLTMSANNGNLVPSSGWYDAGTQLNLANAFSPTTTAGERYVWNGWTGTGNGSYTGMTNPASNAIVINGPITETSGWTHQYQVSFTTSPTGGGTTMPSGPNVWCDAGGTISLSATPNTGYTFSLWNISGSTIATNLLSASTNATVNGPSTITAMFTLQVIPETTPLAFVTCFVIVSSAIAVWQKRSKHSNLTKGELPNR